MIWKSGCWVTLRSGWLLELLTELTTIFLCTMPFGHGVGNQTTIRLNNQVILEQACSWPLRRQSFVTLSTTFFSIPLPRWTVLRAARANPGSGPKRQMGIFKKISLRHGMRLHNHLIHLPEEVRTQMVVWIVISLQIKQGVFQNIHFWMSFLAIFSPFSDNLRAK